MDELKVRKIIGDTTIDNLLRRNCEFSGRLVDTCCGVEEMTATIITDDGDIVTVHYLISKYDIANADDCANYDYSNYYFTIN